MLRRLLGRGAARASALPIARVAPWLIVGPALPAADYQILLNHGVTHVLDLRREASDDADAMERLGLHWRRVPIDDRAAPTDAQWEEIENWCAAIGRREPRSVPPATLYVHCQGGLGRAPAIAIALLMSRGFTLSEAYRLVLAARHGALPTASQEAWLRSLAAS